MSIKPPTTKQLGYLKALAERTGQTFRWPHTSREASAEIRRLKGIAPDSRIERRIERTEIADAIASGPDDSSRVTSREVAGWGSSATWTQRP